MKNEQNPVDLERLKKILDSGVNLRDALNEIGEKRASYVITQLEKLSGKPNTKECALAYQYNGCLMI